MQQIMIVKRRGQNEHLKQGDECLRGMVLLLRRNLVKEKEGV